MPLTGERTRLRAVEPEDAAIAFRWVNDPEVTEHVLIRYPMSMGTEREWAERAAARPSFGDAVFAIEALDDGALIGVCGLHHQTPEDRVSELGVNIGEKRRWGQGYGFDALRTLLCYGFRELNLRRIWLRVDENHPRGIALYERLGFRHEGRLRSSHYSRGRALDFLAMGIAREEFDARYGAFEEVGDVPRG
jgi:diamine N-acetyltransferase